MAERSDIETISIIDQSVTNHYILIDTLVSLIAVAASLGWPKKSKSWKCFAPHDFSGAEFHEDSKNTIIFHVAQL